MLLRYLLPTALAVAAGLTFAAPAAACPGCGPPTGQTLTNEVAQADFILYGTLGNDRKVFTIPRFVPPDPKPFKYLVFFNVVNGDVDPYRGVVVDTNSKMPEYVKGALAVKGKDAATRLRYFFDYLESPEIEVAADAYNEFAVAEYKEVQELAPKLPFDTVLRWLQDPNTRASRYGLYGLLLGHSGKPEHAAAMRKLMDAPESKFSSGLDGMLMGYVMLDPKAGYEYLLKLVGDPDKEFLVKHAGLKALRFFWEYRPDVLDRKRVLAGMSALLAHPDLADMPIDDLRKWKAWDMTAEVLKLAGQKSHNELPINNRSILKLAMAASWADPKNAAAAAHVEKVRAENPARVKLVEELLKDEQKVTPAPPEPPKK